MNIATGNLDGRTCISANPKTLSKSKLIDFIVSSSGQAAFFHLIKDTKLSLTFM